MAQHLLAVVLIAAIVTTNVQALAWLAERMREPVEPRQPVPWPWWWVLGLEALSAVLLSLVFEWSGLSAVEPATADTVAPPPDMEGVRRLLLGMTVSSLAIVPAGAMLLLVACRATLADLGFSLGHAAADFGLGVRSFACVIVPVYAINAVVSQWVDGQHPLQTLLQENKTPELLALMVLAAGVGAPLAEEFLYRVVLQGWLERFWNVGDPTTLDTDDHAPAAERPVVWAPIGISATIFSLLHINHGAAPIALFFLALVLGWLYQRTHRIWPGLVVHASLNLTSCIIFAST